MLAVLLALAAGPSPVVPVAPPDLLLTLAHLALEVDLDLDGGTLRGRAVIRVRNDGRRPGETATFLLNRGLRYSAATTLAGEPLALTQGVVSFSDFENLEVNRARVSLAGVLEPGGEATVVLRFEGRLRSYAHTGMSYVRDSITPAFTILRSDAFAFPVPGLPSIAAMRAAPLPSFGFDLTVTAPATHLVAAGGRETRRSSTGDRVRWSFRADNAPYLIAVIGRYGVIERGGVRLVHFPEDSLGARRVVDRVGAAMALFERWFGPLPVPPRVTIMEIPEGWGSQASLSGGIIQTAAAFSDSTRLVELYHEISHLWNPEDRDPPSARWNEGLATFLQIRVGSELDGLEIRQALDRLLDRARAGLAREPRLERVPLARYGAERLTDHSYTVAALMFALLDRALGSDGFAQRYRRLFQSHATSGVTLADLEAAFGDQPAARRILRDWVTTAAWAGRVSRSATFADLAAGSR